MKKIKKGDRVKVICGRSRGSIGIVLQIMNDMALVENINLIKKHTKPNPSADDVGGVISKPSPIHISNLALCDNLGNILNIKFEFSKNDNKNIRVLSAKK